MSDKTDVIDFEKESHSLIDGDGNIDVDAVVELARSIAARVEESTIQRIINDGLCHKKIGKWGRLYAPPSGDKEGS